MPRNEGHRLFEQQLQTLQKQARRTNSLSTLIYRKVDDAATDTMNVDIIGLVSCINWDAITWLLAFEDYWLKGINGNRQTYAISAHTVDADTATPVGVVMALPSNTPVSS